MVRVRLALPRTAAGAIDVPQWADMVLAEHPTLSSVDLNRALEAIQAPGDPDLLEASIDLAALLLELQLDSDALLVGLVYRAFRLRELTSDALAALLTPAGLALLRSVDRLGRASELPLQDPPMLTSGAEDQIDNVRHLLESLIDDARVALIKLAERVVVLRLAKSAPAPQRERLARESLALFAPLAGRLGIWHLKWAIEDLAFRYLEPEIYQRIASQLDGRRDQRVRHINALELELHGMLRRAGIAATVVGRAKHIYSIWRKMQEKDLDVSQVHDVRALRVLVDDAAACYQVLGVIHTAWRHLPNEFDDYIANPKDNGYQSIHTAVVGPREQILEVQIRTQTMHDEAEFGVCAHWSYKEPQRNKSNDRVLWLRQLLEWHDATDGVDSFESLLNAGFYDERIYVSTPQGHVLDLPQGATPIDFAYRVHTEIGHRCLAARVDGEPYALNHPLRTGQRVRIITAPQSQSQPQRRWLEEHLGFVHTTRARAKIQQWLRRCSPAENAASGMDMWRDACRRLGLASDPDAAVAQLEYPSSEDFYRALALGEVSVATALGAIPLLHSTPGPLQVSVQGANRDALLRDITAILTDQHISLVSTQARVASGARLVDMVLEFEPVPLAQLSRVLDRLACVPDVIDVHRVT